MKEAIITSSILILCIALIRKVCRGKIRASIQYALWLLVAVRLVIPGITWMFPNVLPESSFSMLNIIERIEMVAVEHINIPQPELPIQVTFPLSGLPSLTQTGSDGPTSVFLAGKIGWTFIDFLSDIWCLGMVVVGIWMLAVNLRFSKKLHKCRTHFAKHIQVGNIECKLPIYLIKELSTPCLYGLPGRQAVYLPEEVAEDEQKRKHILAHEFCHYKHGDIFWSTLRCILVTVYWFHPLVWYAAALSKQDCELACDEAAIRILGEEERIAYGKTLISLIARRTKVKDIAFVATTMTAGARSIKERVRFIAEKPRRLMIALLAVIAVVAVVVVFTFTKAKEEPSAVEATLEALVESRTLYVGDASKTSQIARALPMSDGVHYDYLEMQTSEEPYEVTLYYTMTAGASEPMREEIFFLDAALMFASIENLGQCSFCMEGDIERTYYRVEFEELFGELYLYSATKEDFEEFYNRVVESSEEEL